MRKMYVVYMPGCNARNEALYHEALDAKVLHATTSEYLQRVREEVEEMARVMVEQSGSVYARGQRCKIGITALEQALRNKKHAMEDDMRAWLEGGDAEEALQDAVAGGGAEEALQDAGDV